MKCLMDQSFNIKCNRIACYIAFLLVSNGKKKYSFLFISLIISPSFLLLHVVSPAFSDRTDALYTSVNWTLEGFSSFRYEILYTLYYQTYYHYTYPVLKYWFLIIKSNFCIILFYSSNLICAHQVFFSVFKSHVNWWKIIQTLITNQQQDNFILVSCREVPSATCDSSMCE